MAAKSPPTSLGWALLSLLARQPLSGYDLAQKLDEKVGFFWRAQHSQIYPELQRLTRAGHVTFKVVKQSDRPDKKLYTISRRGREALAAWVTSPFEPAPLRDELTLRAYALWLADPARAAELFRGEQARHLERLSRYQEFERQIETGWAAAITDASTPEFATWATLKRGLGYEEEYARWCGWMADRLDRSRKPISRARKKD